MRKILFGTALAISFQAAWAKPEEASPAASSRRAVTYICQTANGKAVFTSIPQGRCTPSQMNGAEEMAAASSPEEASSETADDIEKIWRQSEYTNWDDIKLLPPAPPVPVEVTLRNQPAPVIRRPAPVRPAPVPPTRKQLLERDIRNEEAALRREEAALALAKQSGNTNRIHSLSQTVADRRSGLNALKQELQQYP